MWYIMCIFIMVNLAGIFLGILSFSKSGFPYKRRILL
jgi:hypothetical protein